MDWSMEGSLGLVDLAKCFDSHGWESNPSNPIATELQHGTTTVWPQRQSTKGCHHDRAYLALHI